MAGQRLTDRAALASNPASDDILMVVDISDVSGSAAGTSKKVITPYVITSEKVTINNAELTALHTTGKTLVGLAGANKIIQPLSVYLEYTVGSVASITSPTLYFGHINNDTTYYWDNSRYWSRTAGGYNGVSWIFNGGTKSSKGASATSIANLGFYMFLDIAMTPPTGASIDVWTTYRLLDIS